MNVMAVTAKFVTTGDAIAAYNVTENLGIVRGLIVRSRSVVGSIGAGLQTLFGGNITLYATLCEKARQDAFELMLAHANEMGADGIIAMRYDTTELGVGVTEVLAYGTAVKLRLAK
jgi:uncharacterized protein YbjQ (UPF0145 family)